MNSVAQKNFTKLNSKQMTEPLFTVMMVSGGYPETYEKEKSFQDLKS